MKAGPAFLTGLGLGGPLTEAVTPTLAANVEAFANKDQQVTLEEVANKFSISKASVHMVSETAF